MACLARSLLAVLMLLSIACADDRTVVVGDVRMAGAEVNVDGKPVGHLARKRVIEFVSFDRQSGFVRTRTVAKLILPSILSGKHVLTVRPHNLAFRRAFCAGEPLIDLGRPDNQSVVPGVTDCSPPSVVPDHKK